MGLPFAFIPMPETMVSLLSLFVRYYFCLSYLFSSFAPVHGDDNRANALLIRHCWQQRPCFLPTGRHAVPRPYSRCEASAEP